MNKKIFEGFFDSLGPESTHVLKIIACSRRV